jgi:Na+-transporting NADH:ubiquinone oxidoreductase subunit C
MSREVLKILGFCALVCAICSVFVGGAAVGLKDLQEENKILDRQKKVLTVAGLIKDGEKLTPDQVKERFSKNITATVIDMKTGADAEGVDVATFDQRKVSRDVTTSIAAAPNPAKVMRLPKQAIVYQVAADAGGSLIIPIEGKGLWSTLYGFLALEPDLTTVKGITFYEHGETPGLGGEIDNPKWKALWPGRKAFDENFEPTISVIKGVAGSVTDDPTHIDGLSGATITCRGVTALVQLWLGDQGYGPYIKRLRGALGGEHG